MYGILADNGPHLGDLANIYIHPDGTATIQQLIPIQLADLKKNNLTTGLALIIHEKPDDYQSQPIGNAGGHIACGVLTQ